MINKSASLILLSNVVNAISDTIINISDIKKNKGNSYNYITTENMEIEIKNESLRNIIDNFLDEINIEEIDKGQDNKLVQDKLEYIFTSTTNQKNNEDKNNITLNLGQCENILKNHYNISNDSSLYILQVIFKEKEMKIPKIEYEVYYPLENNSRNLKKLNLTLCKNTKIEISITVKIDDTLDKYNSSSDYYNNICSKAVSKSGTDIILKDRRKEYINNNMFLCEENCILVDYNYSAGKSKCSCDIKFEINENPSFNFNQKDFFKNFIDIENISNLYVIKCYKTVFKIKELIKNYGFFIILFILVLYFICLFIFIFFSYYKLKKEITKIFYALKTNEVTPPNTNKIKEKN